MLDPPDLPRSLRKPEPKTAIFRNQNPNQATKRIQIGFERAAGDAPLLASDLLVFSLV